MLAMSDESKPKSKPRTDRHCDYKASIRKNAGRTE